jgi:hypothetical protein
MLAGCNFAHVYVAERSASVPDVNQQLCDGIDRNPAQSWGRTKRRTLDLHREDLDTLFQGELVHALLI